MLASMDIPVDIPANLEMLREYADRVDGPKALARIRNEVIHPKDVSIPYLLAPSGVCDRLSCECRLGHVSFFTFSPTRGRYWRA